MGTKRWKPGWALAETARRVVVKVLNVQGVKLDDEEDEHVDEGLTFGMDEYPELQRSADEERGCWRSLFTLSCASQKLLSSSLDRALQCSPPMSASVSGCSLMDTTEAINKNVKRN